MSKPPTVKRRSRIADLGNPFLVTVSLGAPLAGCTSAEMDSNPPRPQCPETVPVTGTPCQKGPASCDYGDCGGTPNMHATCDIDGHWQVLTSTCNPPPPPPPPQPCPTSLPKEGEACLPTALAVCTYDACDPTARCVDGQWQVDTEVECEPTDSDAGL